MTKIYQQIAREEGLPHDSRKVLWHTLLGRVGDLLSVAPALGKETYREGRHHMPNKTRRKNQF